MKVQQTITQDAAKILAGQFIVINAYLKKKKNLKEANYTLRTFLSEQRLQLVEGRK